MYSINHSQEVSDVHVPAVRKFICDFPYGQQPITNWLIYSFLQMVADISTAVYYIYHPQVTASGICGMFNIDDVYVICITIATNIHVLEKRFQLLGHA